MTSWIDRAFFVKFINIPFWQDTHCDNFWFTSRIISFRRMMYGRKWNNAFPFLWNLKNKGHFFSKFKVIASEFSRLDHALAPVFAGPFKLCHCTTILRCRAWTAWFSFFSNPYKKNLHTNNLNYMKCFLQCLLINLNRNRDHCQ